MLGHFRNLAKNFLVRIILLMLAISFVIAGINGLFMGRGNKDIVIFSEAPNITKSEFLKVKSQEINFLERENGITLNEEDINQYEFNKAILQRMIDDRMLSYLIDYYDLNLSDDLAIQFIKQSPMFHNDQGKFDPQIFKSAFKNSHNKEQEYLKDIKQRILKNILVAAFIDTIKIPNTFLNNRIEYLAESRTMNLVEINLESSNVLLTTQEPTENELQKFYNDNKILFTAPEKRSISYIKITKQYLQSKINIDESELLEFYNENAEDFGAPLDKILDQVSLKLKENKLEEMRIEFIKNLEDDVASGLNLTEIAEKYDITIQQANDVTTNSIEFITQLFEPEEIENSNILEDIFQMSKMEVSYPIESNTKTNFVLIEVKDITPSKILDFNNELLPKVTKLFKIQKLRQANLDLINSVSKEYKITKNYTQKDLANMGIKSATKFHLIRAEINDPVMLDKLTNNITHYVIKEAFQITPGENTKVVESDNKAYFIHVLKEIKMNKSKLKQLELDYGAEIQANFKNAIIEELISSLVRKNNTQIKDFN